MTALRQDNKVLGTKRSVRITDMVGEMHTDREIADWLLLDPHRTVNIAVKPTGGYLCRQSCLRCNR